ncbi:MAG TPA: hypothetical protein VGO50_11850 [Pyrinomonadaceae bacterium]|jgi:hypothetical protein|nr:hypothetical protein [Pyrinomonadaceae bacterium]
MKWSKFKTRIAISVVCALVFIVVYVFIAVAISKLLPNTFMTRDIDLGWVILPPLIFVPVLGAMMLSIWLNFDLHGDFSMMGFLYRAAITFVPPMLFYSSIAYLLLGRLKWFRETIDEGTLPEPPPPPEF